MRLGCSSADLAALVEKRVLRRLNDSYRLTFVGIAVLRDRTVYCRPALHAPKGSDLLEEIDRVDRILRIYESRGSARQASGEDVAQQFYEDDRAERVVRELDILSALLEWTQSYGFHQDVHLMRRSGGVSNIDWPATIARNLPFKTRTGTVYLEPVSHASIRELSDLALLQARALVELYGKYREVAHLAFRGAREFVEEAEAIRRDSHGEGFPSIRDYLSQSFDNTNRDHDKDLIRLLLAYFADERDLTDVGAIRLYGTSSFHLVWEDMCRAGVGDPKAQPAFANPRYLLAGEEKAVDAQRPDIVLEQESRLYVLDAKYYPDFPSAPPGLEDVRKQIFYGLSATKPGAVLGFLIPGQVDKLVEKAGIAEMHLDGKKDERFPAVTCLRLDWSKLADNYLWRQATPGLAEAITTALA